MNLPVGLTGTLDLWVMVVGASSRGFLASSPLNKLANSAENYFIVFPTTSAPTALNFVSCTHNVNLISY